MSRTLDKAGIHKVSPAFLICKSPCENPFGYYIILMDRFRPAGPVVIKPPPAWSVGPGRIPVEGEVGLMEIRLFELSITIAPVVALAAISLVAKMLRHNKQKS